jgi:hypothetical protein
MVGELTWEKPTQFLGRNGYFKAKGVMVETYQAFNEPQENWEEDTVRIYPITSKMEYGRCYIEIPRSSIDVFIQILLRAVLRI